MTTLKGIFPNPKLPSRKNFIQENVKNLRRMEQYFHSNKEVDDFQRLRISKQQNKYQNIAPKINTRGQGSPDTIVNDVNNIKEKKPDKRVPSVKIPESNRISPEPPIDSCDIFNDKKFKSQGIQTITDGDLVRLYAEGTIRYPSGRGPRKSPVKQSAKQKEVDQNLDLDLPTEKGDAGTKPQKNLDHSPTRENTDHVKMNKNKISMATKLAAQLNNGTIPPSYRKGVVPKYIKERKEEKLQQEIKAQAEAELIADCPDGHVPLPDNERKETLRKLKKTYQDFVNKLNMIPIRSDTLRSQRQKIEIEKELNKLEEGIKVFSRPKVFIKINA